MRMPMQVDVPSAALTAGADSSTQVAASSLADLICPKIPSPGDLICRGVATVAGPSATVLCGLLPPPFNAICSTVARTVAG